MFLMILHQGLLDAQHGFGLFGSGVVHKSLEYRHCQSETTTIERTNCKVEYDEECETKEKVVGDKVTYKKECEEKEVDECRPVHYIPRFCSI